MKDTNENNSNIGNKNIIEQNVIDTESKSRDNFVPSYNKKNKDTETNNKKEKKEKRVKSKITFVLLAVILLTIIVIISTIILKGKNSNINNYDKLMNNYGLSKLYNNKTSNSSDYITKSEAMKMVIAITLNTTDITEYMPNDLLYKTTVIEDEGESSDTISLDTLFRSNETTEKIDEEYENEYWVRYAKSINFIGDDEINSDNYNEKISYLDVLKYISKAKTSLLGKNLDIELEPEFKNYGEFDNETKWILSDLVRNEIIENTKSKLNVNKSTTKADFNEIIIKFVLKYNLITVGDERVNINEEKMPNNKDEFAYTLASVDKSVYEIENYRANENYKNAIDVYSTLKEYYEMINTKIEDYYNKLINIDYENIIVEDTYLSIVPNTMYIISEDEIKEYVEYVKQNKIKISGEAKVQNPIIYFDGNVYRVRTKLKYNIENADNLQNIFFKDVDTTYEKGEKIIYIDAPIAANSESTNFYIMPETISNMISGKVVDK